MDWTKVGETAAIITAGSGTQTVALPGARAQDDIVIVGISSDVSCFNCISSAGYNSLNNSASADPGQHSAWKRMGATPDTSIAITRNGLIRRAVAIQVWRGANQTTAIDNGVSNSTGGSGDPDPGAHATITNGALRLVIGYLDDDDATVSAAPPGYSNLVTANTGQGSSTVGATVMIASKVSGDAGAEDPGAFVTSGDDAWACDHFALRLPIIAGPFDLEAGQTFVAGCDAGQVHLAGAVAAQTFVAGCAAGQVFNAGCVEGQVFTAGSAAGQVVPD